MVDGVMVSEDVVSCFVVVVVLAMTEEVSFVVF